ncbi:MAG: histidine ammonia-lyase [bacterium]
MVLVIDGKNLRLKDLINVSVNNQKIKIDRKAIENVKRSSEFLQELIKSGNRVYGVNTGVGDLANISIDDNKLYELQLNIIRSHSSGYGKRASPQSTRATMLILANSLLSANSGVRIDVIKTIVDMLNKDVIPIIPEKGSIGASGDLAPLAHIALSLIGEGRVFYNEEEVDSIEVLNDKGIKPVILEPKEGLSLINGCHYSTAILALQIKRVMNLISCSCLAEALLVEVLRSPLSPFDRRIQKARPHPGQGKVASVLRMLLKGSKVSRGSIMKVQDAYSIRCYPQVVGPTVDTVVKARSVCEIEMNSSVDNPLLFYSDKKYLSGGNFHGQPIAFMADFLSISITALSALMERQLSRILDSKLSGLPSFLTNDAGLKAGYMTIQYTAVSLLAESRVFSHPASIEAVPVSAGQEDHQSMAPVCAMKLRDILDNSEVICGILLMCLAQAIDLAGIERNLCKRLKSVYDVIRSYVKFYDDDRPVSDDIKVITELMKSGGIVKATGMDIEGMLFG